MRNFSSGATRLGIEGFRVAAGPVFPAVALTKVAEPARVDRGRVEWESAHGGTPAGWRHLPVGSTVEGELLAPIAVGKMIGVLRRIRNGRPARGLFVSSPVRRIRGDRITTENAVYELKLLPEVAAGSEIRGK